MRFLANWLLAGVATMTIATQAHATTTVNFFANATNGDFIPALPAGVIDRSLSLLGSISYDSGLPDGTYGAGTASAVTLTLHRTLTVTGGTEYTADYSYSLSDLSDISVTLVGGLPAKASFTVVPKLPDAFTLPAFGTQYLSFSLDSANPTNAYDFYQGTSPTAMTLFAHEGDGGVTSITQSDVPEPTTWALMVVGIGAVAAAMRRRQRPTVRYSFA